VALDRAGVPQQADSGGDCVVVLAQAAGEAAQGGQTGGLCPLDPVAQAVAVAGVHHGREGTDPVVSSAQLGAAGQDLVELRLVVRLQIGGLPTIHPVA
jgi:hypothetical protein